MMTNQNPRKYVLVVEDDTDFAHLLMSVLIEEGYDIAHAADGEQALALVRQRRPDAITLDIRMPRKTGLIFFRQIKADLMLKSIPVIVVSGLIETDPDMDTLIHSILEAEGIPIPEAYVAKPIDRAAFVEQVREVLSANSCCGS